MQQFRDITTNINAIKKNTKNFSQASFALYVCKKYRFAKIEFPRYIKIMLKIILKRYILDKYVEIKNFGIFTTRKNVGMHRSKFLENEIYIPEHDVPCFRFDKKAKYFINGYNYFSERKEIEERKIKNKIERKQKYKEKYLSCQEQEKIN